MPGTFTVILTVKGPGGIDTMTRTNYIAVYERVQADFVASPTTGIAPLTVVFTNTSTGSYVESLWDFGDGETSDLDSPTHTYARCGIPTVSLLVRGPGGVDKESKEGYVRIKGCTYLPIIIRQP
jgi:PKD repeat protein